MLKILTTHVFPLINNNIPKMIEEYAFDQDQITLFSFECIRKQKGIDWAEISEFQKLPDNFIREFQNEIDWTAQTRYQGVSLEIIDEFQDRVSWYWISEEYKLSKEFIEQYSDRVDWHKIYR